MIFTIALGIFALGWVVIIVNAVRVRRNLRAIEARLQAIRFYVQGNVTEGDAARTYADSLKTYKPWPNIDLPPLRKLRGFVHWHGWITGIRYWWRAYYANRGEQ